MLQGDTTSALNITRTIARSAAVETTATISGASRNVLQLDIDLTKLDCDSDAGTTTACGAGRCGCVCVCQLAHPATPLLDIPRGPGTLSLAVCFLRCACWAPLNSVRPSPPYNVQLPAEGLHPRQPCDRRFLRQRGSGLRRLDHPGQRC